MTKRYHEVIIRVRRNTGPVGGPWVCEQGRWQQDTLSGKRDRFIVARTIKVGTRQECEFAEAEARKVADIKKGTEMTTTNKTDRTLVYKLTGELVRPGDLVQVGSERMKVVAIRPPRTGGWGGSTGRVLVQAQGSNADELSEYEYYPSVIGAQWVDTEPVGAHRRNRNAKRLVTNMTKTATTRKCGLCEEQDAEIVVNVTSLDGEVLDTAAYCRECVRGELARIGLVIGEVR